MQQHTHLIPIVAGFEIIPADNHCPVLDKPAISALAAALADDLSKQLPDGPETFLVVAGMVVEPNQLLRPGFDVWRAMDQLAKPVLRDQGLHSGLLAIGAHQGQMPDDRLQPSQYSLMGQFVCIPMLLIVAEADGEVIETQLETVLFEAGSINPPARALLSTHARLESVHGQLLTRNDLLALQRVQLDTAGLVGFWDVLEALLLSPNHDHRFALPGGLRASWDASQHHVCIVFVTFQQWMQAKTQAKIEPRDYQQWMRAYRTLLALLESHGVAWLIQPQGEAIWDDHRAAILESHPADLSGAQPAHQLTEHIDPDLGLVAWTLIEDERMIHIYPSHPETIRSLQEDFSRRGITDTVRHHGLCYNVEKQQLTAAPISD